MFICATNMVLPHPMREANTYQESLPQHFCQPCMGTLSNSAIRKLPDGSCPKLVDETSKMLKLLRKDFRASGANMRKLKRLVVSFVLEYTVPTVINAHIFKCVHNRYIQNKKRVKFRIGFIRLKVPVNKREREREREREWDSPHPNLPQVKLSSPCQQANYY